MASVNVTNNATTHSQQRGNRVLVRNSSGTPYVVMTDEDATGIQVWKGNSTTPTSFSEQDAGNAPASGVYGSVSAAIDSTDIIHIVYMEDDGKTSACRYVTFDADGTTDTYSGDTDIDSNLGGDPVTINQLFSAIAIDSNDVPHVVYTRSDSNMGADYQTATYSNRIGGSWRSGVEIEGATAEFNVEDYDIAIDADNLPVVSYYRINSAFRGAIGNANNATSFTLQTFNSGVNNQSPIPRESSIAVDSEGNHHIAWIQHSAVNDWQLKIREHSYGDAWTTLQTETTVTSNTSDNEWFTPALVIDGTNKYIFLEEENHDVEYWYDTGSGWTSGGTLETGTYNTVRAKWAFWVDNDSTGALVTQGTKYYFDGSDAAAADASGNWTDETNTDDGNFSTFGYESSTTANTESSGFLKIEGTNAPASGGTIDKVIARITIQPLSDSNDMNAKIYTDGEGETLATFTDSDMPLGPSSAVHGVQKVLSTPSGGWTWGKVQGLEFKIWDASTASNAWRLYGVQVFTFTKSDASELDYTFADEVTNEEDIFWNTLSLGGGEETPGTPPHADIIIFSGENKGKKV